MQEANNVNGAAEAQAIPDTGFTYSGNVVLCIVPVPRALKNLADLDQSRPGVANEARAEGTYLLARYCRSVENPHFAAAGLMEALGEYCTQMSGVFNGDQVYWVTCSPHYDERE